MTNSRTNWLAEVRDLKRLGHRVFMPAIYEHKAALIGKSPADVCASADLLTEACVAEFETYRFPNVVAGVDIYNIEPEAFGCRIFTPEGPSEVPVVAAPLADILDNLDAYAAPDPARTGRMPLMVEAARRSVQSLGAHTLVQAPISAPFTMAAELLGLENMIYAMFDEPDKVQRLLELCLETACTYGRALLATGAQLAVFDSRASCSVISPEQYTEFVQPTHLSLLKSLRADGAEFTSLIVGGNTTPAAESLFATGADLVLSDFNIDPEPFLTLSASHPTVVKVNLDPALFESDIGLEEGTRVAAALLRGRGRAVVSTGIIPYSTPSARLLKARDVIESFEN